MLQTRWLGLTPYEDALDTQKDLHAEVRAGHAGVVLGLEHPPVITLGVRGNIHEDLRGSPLTLDGFEIHHTDRGGQATLHSPGQLVIYPILPFKRWGMGARDYVSLLLEVTAEVLRGQGLEATADDSRAGVYTPNGKIAFCGLRLQDGVSRHGLSVNLKNDLGLFRQIRPCGSSIEHLTSLERENARAVIDGQAFFDVWIRCFQERRKLILKH